VYALYRGKCLLNLLIGTPRSNIPQSASYEYTAAQTLIGPTNNHCQIGFLYLTLNYVDHGEDMFQNQATIRRQNKVDKSCSLKDGVWTWLPVVKLWIQVWEGNIELEAFGRGVLSVFEALGKWVATVKSMRNRLAFGG